MVYLTFAVSFIVYIEPAPVDLMFLVLMVLFVGSGLSITIGAATMTVLLLAYNLGGFIAYVPVQDQPKTLMFVVTSTYMAVSAIFLAYYVAHDPVGRFGIIRLGLIAGGIFAAICGLIDYFQFGGLFADTPLKGRATGTFKDPNVFSTYLIFPALLLIQGLMLGKARFRFLSLLGLLVIASGIFLSFSRGAWVNFLAASLLLVTLTFILNGDLRIRRRIIFFSLVAALCGASAFAALMSIESVRDMFVERFSLLQSYDAGETGRFGRQLRSIPELMARPLGFGPLQFGKHFGADPHNTFVNAFSAYGWLGGICYVTLVITTIMAGLKSIFTRSPWQNAAIVVLCPLLTTLFQGVQIDTDHWRHLYWLIGLCWGLYAASLQPVAVVNGLAALRHESPGRRAGA